MVQAAKPVNLSNKSLLQMSYNNVSYVTAAPPSNLINIPVRTH